MNRTTTARLVLAVALITALAATSVGYVLYAAARDRDDAVTGTPAGAATTGSAPPLTLVSGKLLFVDSTPGPRYGTLSAVAVRDPAGPRQHSDISCVRVYAAAGRVLCLRATQDLVGQYQAVVLDEHLKQLRSIPVAGLPSRARVSPDGRIASWTVFVHGDSYASVGFSTRTSVLNLDTGELVGSLESFAVEKDGAPYRSADTNFWGVTMTADDNTFYATMATRGTTYLVRGDLRARRVVTVTTNVECPSLSPDGTRIAFKRRVEGADGRQPWRLTVLDLATLKQTPLAEIRSVDDQVAWLDDRTIAYSLPEPGISSYDLWAVPADGTGAARMLLAHGSSPAPPDA